MEKLDTEKIKINVVVKPPITFVSASKTKRRSIRNELLDIIFFLLITVFVELVRTRNKI